MSARILRHLVPIFVLIAVLQLWLVEPAFLQELRNRAFDLFVQIEPRAYQPAPVKIVAIDEESLKRLGQWPWPRTLLAELIARLQDAGVAVIALDIILAEPDRGSAINFLNEIPHEPTRNLLAQEVSKFLPLDNDEVLRETMARGGVVTAFALTRGEPNPAPVRHGGFAFLGENPTRFIPTVPTNTTSLRSFQEAAAGNGFVSIIRDRDGVVRSVPLILGYKPEGAEQGEFYSSLAVEALRVAQGASTVLVKASGSVEKAGSGDHTGIQAIRVGSLTIPTTPSGQILLYPTGHKPERYISAWQILDESTDLSPLAGQIILIGASAVGLHDIHSTALEKAIPGVELQAQVIEQAILNKFLRRPFWADWLEVGFILVSGVVVMVAFAGAKMGARWSALGGAIVLPCAVAASWYAFKRQGVLIDPVSPALAAVSVYIGAVVTAYLQSEGERRFVRQAFGQYLAPALVEQIADKHETLRLGGETRELSILFCDIRGFTDIAERLDAEETTRLINRYLTPMTSIIMERGGTIDKYMGDAIMAFWNAPIDDADHAQHAIETVLAMREGLAALNAELSEQAEGDGGEPIELRVGYGVATGLAHVGNMGSDQRFDYSALGDTVNLASRLEGQSVTYHLDAIVSEATCSSCDAALLEIDLIRVKGRDQPARIFALLGDAGLAEKHEFLAFSERQANFLSAYRQRRWDEAENEIRSLRTLGKEFGLSAYYDVFEERIANHRRVPPGSDWQGVFDALSK